MESSSNESRRQFLELCAGSLAITVLAGCTPKIVRATSGSTTPEGSPEVLNSVTASFRAGLSPGDGLFLGDGKLRGPDDMPILVVRNAGQNDFTVLSSACTHKGCRVDLPAAGLITCSCHGSMFGLNGNVKAGPAESPLRRYRYSYDAVAQTITVYLGITVNVSALDDDGKAILTTTLGPDEAPILIVRRPGGTYAAISTRCTHKGCSAELKESLLVCPCHGSQFDLSGTVISGPAELPLSQYAATHDATAKKVTISF